MPVKKVEETKQVSLTCTYLCDTQYETAMFKILNIKNKYKNNKYLKQKINRYENEDFIFINKSKIKLELQKHRKYRVIVLFDDFYDALGNYILYFSDTHIVDKGEYKAPKRIVLDVSSDDEN